jgi:hypothetical protein
MDTPVSDQIDRLLGFRTVSHKVTGTNGMLGGNSQVLGP